MASANHKRPGFLRQVAMTASRHDSPDRRGTTVLPHGSELSSPLVEPVAYLWDSVMAVSSWFVPHLTKRCSGFAPLRSANA